MTEPDGCSLTSAETGALAHLYRAEVYRSTIWRSRLDNTTNWSVVTTGLALSISYSSPNSSPLPLILVGMLITVFLMFEARRYRYFNVWRARCRLLETDFYAPMLRGEGAKLDDRWNTLLSSDYIRPNFHISYLRAIGRRLRKNYVYILIVQGVAYFGKLAIHPTAMTTVDEMLERAAIGPIPGEVVMLCGVCFHSGWMMLAYVTWRIELNHRRPEKLISIA